MIARLLISPILDIRVKEIEKILIEFGISRKHPDLLLITTESKLGISEARKIKEHFSLKPYSAKGRIVVLEDASKLTTEAQNALLKTLEELPENAILILGASSDAKFLPTILSRCQISRIQSSEFRVQNYKEDIEKLFKATLAERFEYIEKLKEKEEFLKSMTAYFHKNRNFRFLKELLKAEEWAEQNVNIRAILEYLMLVMPQRL